MKNENEEIIASCIIAGFIIAGVSDKIYKLIKKRKTNKAFLTAYSNVKENTVEGRAFERVMKIYHDPSKTTEDFVKACEEETAFINMLIAEKMF